MEEIKRIRILLERILVLVSTFLVVGLYAVCADDQKSKIRYIGLTGLFENYDKNEYFNEEYLILLDKTIHKVKFDYLNSTYSVPFLVTHIKTIYDKEKEIYSDEVKIEYFSMALSDFYHHDAILKFKGYDENGNMMAITKVVSYREANKISSGWMLKKTIFPVEEVTFNAKDYGKNKGVTDRAWFILHFSYPASEK